MGSLRFSVWRSMLSANSDSFISSFLTWMSGISIKTWKFGILWKLGLHLNIVWVGFLWAWASWRRARAALQLPGKNGSSVTLRTHWNTEGPGCYCLAVDSPLSRSLLMSLLLTPQRLVECWLSAGPPLISPSSRMWGSSWSSHLIPADAVGMGQEGRWDMKSCVLCCSLSGITQKRPLCALLPWVKLGASASPAQQLSEGILLLDCFVPASWLVRAGSISCYFCCSFCNC